MAHRAEEKERRRQERIAQQEAARKAAARKRTLQVGAGVALGLIVIGVVAIVALAGGGGSKDKTANVTKLATDAKAAGCTFSPVQVRGPQPHGEQGHLQDEPAHVGRTQPDAAQDGHLPRGQLAAEGELRPHARARAHRVPVQAGHARRRRGQAARAGRGAVQRHRRLPRAALREQHEHAGPVRGDRVDEVDHLPDRSPRQAIGAMREFRTAFTDKGPEFIP
jgi:hypothetical protein